MAFSRQLLCCRRCARQQYVHADARPTQCSDEQSKLSRAAIRYFAFDTQGPFEIPILRYERRYGDTNGSFSLRNRIERMFADMFFALATRVT